MTTPSELRAQIMNLPCETPDLGSYSLLTVMSGPLLVRQGHKQARYAAAELAQSALAAMQERAEKAERELAELKEENHHAGIERDLAD